MIDTSRRQMSYDAASLVHRAFVRSFVDDDDLGPAQVARARLTGRSRSVPIAFRGLDYDRSKYASRAAGEMITAKPYRRAGACVHSRSRPNLP